ncbi:hypothetical protein Pcaca04_00700 [Pectobacterium carotovorum subsp. carotovorum]|nr:hypothetical protein Pcaca04_00700 [Pectobacterium carotovorum subsp. carotovorum]
MDSKIKITILNVNVAIIVFIPMLYFLLLLFLSIKYKYNGIVNESNDIGNATKNIIEINMNNLFERYNSFINSWLNILFFLMKFIGKI